MNGPLHDLRADGLEPARLDLWIEACGWEALLNRRSTTWRGLDEEQKANLTAEKARALLIEYPTLLRRPILEHEGGILVGFTPTQYSAELVGPN